MTGSEGSGVLLVFFVLAVPFFVGVVVCEAFVEFCFFCADVEVVVEGEFEVWSEELGVLEFAASLLVFALFFFVSVCVAGFSTAGEEVLPDWTSVERCFLEVLVLLMSVFSFTGLSVAASIAVEVVSGAVVFICCIDSSVSGLSAMVGEVDVECWLMMRAVVIPKAAMPSVQ